MERTRLRIFQRESWREASRHTRIEAAIEAKRPFCVVMLDLNQFKQVNDTHGHGAGGSLLTQFAGELRTNIRASDIAGRWEEMNLSCCSTAT